MPNDTQCRAAGVSAVKTSREKERKYMQDLNERFANASYIEKSLTDFYLAHRYGLTVQIFKQSLDYLIK